MKCPNCGKNVRSKKQCAHCGHVFGKDISKQQNQVREEESMKTQTPEPTPTPISAKEEKVERTQRINTKPLKQESDKKIKRKTKNESTENFNHVDIVPKTPRKKGGFLKYIWSLIKLILMVAIVFLAFMFGPQIINGVMDVVNGNTEISKMVPDFVTDFFNKEETTQETTQETTEEESKLTLANSSVDTDNYPVINVSLDFNESLDEVNNETFTFTMKSGQAEKKLDQDYSLIKKGQTLNMSFTDPNLSQDGSKEGDQSLKIESEALKFAEEVAIKLPENQADQKQSESFNEILTNNFKEVGKVSAMVQKLDGKDKSTYVYEDQTQDAGEVIAWFVLARAYEAIKDESLSLDQIIKTNPDLIAKNDTGEVANVAEGTEYTIESLLNLVIQQKDLSAMNHLIQETGGPNKFNLWLNESNYFSTKVTEPLGYDEKGKITGAVTNAQNVVFLLNALSQNKLIDEEHDKLLKEQILQSPITAKYPEAIGITVNNRYEIASNDANTDHQYYSGIIESEGANYLVTLFVNDIEDANATNTAIASTLNELLTMLETGQTGDEETTEEATESDYTEDSQVQLESDTTVQEAPVDNTNPNGNGNINQPGPNDQYSLQYVEGQGEVLLPVVRDNAGNPIQVNWYFDHAEQMYKY